MRHLEAHEKPCAKLWLHLVEATLTYGKQCGGSFLKKTIPAFNAFKATTSKDFADLFWM